MCLFLSAYPHINVQRITTHSKNLHSSSRGVLRPIFLQQFFDQSQIPIRAPSFAPCLFPFLPFSFIKGKGGCTELTTASLASPVFLKSPEESTGPECTRINPNVPELTRMDPRSYPEWTLLVHAHLAPYVPD